MSEDEGRRRKISKKRGDDGLRQITIIEAFRMQPPINIELEEFEREELSLEDFCDSDMSLPNEIKEEEFRSSTPEDQKIFGSIPQSAVSRGCLPNLSTITPQQWILSNRGEITFMKECPICLDNFQTEEEEREDIKIDCGHFFHKDCITRWVQQHNNCPLCRRPIYIELTIEGNYPNSDILDNQLSENDLIAIENWEEAQRAFANYARIQWDWFVEEGNIIIEEFNDQDPGDYMDNVENGIWNIRTGVDMLLGFRTLIQMGSLGDFYGLYALKYVFPNVWSEAIRMGYELAIPDNQ